MRIWNLDFCWQTVSQEIVLVYSSTDHVWTDQKFNILTHDTCKLFKNIFFIFTDIIDAHHCISLMWAAEWIESHTLWNDCHSKFSYYVSSQIDTIRKKENKKKERKKILLVMRALRTYSLRSFPVYGTASLATVILVRISSLALIYLVSGCLPLLTTFLQFAPSLTPVTTNTTSFSMCLVVVFVVSDSTCEWDHTIFVFSVWLT